MASALKESHKGRKRYQLTNHKIMKKIILTFSFLSVLFTLPFAVSAASVTISTVPTVCSSAVFAGNASYSAPDTLTIRLNGTALDSFTSGNSSWSVTYNGNFLGTNTIKAEVSSTTAGIIASATQSFSASCGNQDPMAVTQSWGLTGYQTPLVAIGTIVTDKYGFSEQCPWWYPKWLGCFDISRTEDYLAGLRKAFGLK